MAQWLSLEQYDLVKEQGTGYPAWQEASTRRTEIQRVLDLRQSIDGGAVALERLDQVDSIG
mgnify:CR=1 FL=1